MKKAVVQYEDEIHIFSKKNDNKLDWHIHFHSNIEIVVMRAGCADFYLDGKKYNIGAGDVAIVFPNQIHSYENSRDVDATVMTFLPDVLGADGEMFYSNTPTNPILSDDNEDIFALTDMLFFKYRKTSKKIVSGFLQAITALIASRLSLDKRKKEEHGTVTKLIKFCNDHYMERISLNDVAAHVHISVSRVTDIFKNHFYTTFTEYIQDRRIEYACKVFGTGFYNVTETAFASGFNSVRTFGRVFTKKMGMSPKQYALSLRKG